MYKICKYQQWGGMPYKERTLLKVFQEIIACVNQRVFQRLLSKRLMFCIRLYLQLKFHGADRQGIIAACVYFSCKINKVPRSTNEIASLFKLQIPVMTRGCKKFQEIMQLNKVDISRIHNTNTITLDDFIDRFCSKLNMSKDDVTNIKHISYLCQVYNLVNDNTPPSMAAGCIYLYIKQGGFEINKKEISEISKISEVTINKCFKKLETHSKKLLV